MSAVRTLASQFRRVAAGASLAEVINALNQMMSAFLGGPTLPATSFTDTVTIEKDQAAAFPALVVVNDASGAGAAVYVKLMTHSGTSGDPFVWFTNNATDWAVGLDNSDADALVVSKGAAPGSANALRIDPSTLELLALGNLAWRSGTAAKVTLDHAATADHVVTVQDLDGTLALLGATVGVQNAGHLAWVDNLYDIGAITPALARPRDLYLARNAAVGGALAVTGAATVNGEAIAKAPIVGQMTGGDLTLDATMRDVVGCTAVLSPGAWRVTGIFHFNHTVSGAGDAGNLAQGTLQITGGTATMVPAANTAYAIMGLLSGSVVNQWHPAVQSWVVTVTVATTAKLQANKGGGAGTVLCRQTETAIHADFLGKP